MKPNVTFEVVRSATFLSIAAALLFAPPGFSATRPKPLSSSDLVQIRFDQKLEQQVPLGLEFVDETGRVVKLEDYSRRHLPMVLVPGYYGCPMLCGMVANGLVEALQDVKATPGSDFEIIFFSIDPGETSALAATKKKSFLRRYGRPESADGWHFLTGSQTESRSLSDQIGFRYAYDAHSKQYAHPSGIVIVTPDGKIAQYLFGVTYSARELSNALQSASSRRISSPVKEFLLLCFYYNPITGKYGALVMILVRCTAILVLAGLIWIIIFARRRPGGEAA